MVSILLFSETLQMAGVQYTEKLKIRIFHFMNGNKTQQKEDTIFVIPNQQYVWYILIKMSRHTYKILWLLYAKGNINDPHKKKYIREMLYYFIFNAFVAFLLSSVTLTFREYFLCYLISCLI